MKKWKIMFLSWMVGNLFLIATWAQSIEFEKWVKSLPEDSKTLIGKEETGTHYFAFFRLPDNIFAIYSCDDKRAKERLRMGKSIVKDELGYNGKLIDKRGNPVVDEEASMTDGYHVLKDKMLKLMRENNSWYVNYIPIQKNFHGVMKYFYQEELKYQGEVEPISLEWQTNLKWAR
ncbi:MAG: hypothetical protein R3F23_01860 [Verrucomicrobiia bacterium]